MGLEKDYQRIISRGDITIFENNKYYLVRDKTKDSDDIYPKKDWTLREVLKETGTNIPEE
jgi:hypothetical protein